MISPLVDVGRWILRRPHVPAGAIPLYARRGTLAVPMVFAGLCVGEIVLVHPLEQIARLAVEHRADRLPINPLRRPPGRPSV